MSTANTWETGMIRLILMNTPFTLLGDAAGLLASAGAGSIYVSLHTSDPGEAGAQNTNEATYTGYARLPVARSGAEWSESGGVGQNVNDQVWPICTAGVESITHFGVGTSSAGAGKLMYSGALTLPLSVQPGVTPRVLAGNLTVTQT